MIRLIIVIMCILLEGCANFIDNPYQNLSRDQLMSMNASQLCGVLMDNRYKTNSNITWALNNKGYHDCSASEIYCREKLGLVPGSDMYSNCKIQRDQYELNAAQYQLNVRQAEQQNNFQNQMIQDSNQPVIVPPRTYAPNFTTPLPYRLH